MASGDDATCRVNVDAHAMDSDLTTTKAQEEDVEMSTPRSQRLYTLQYRPTTPLKIFLSYGHDRFQQLTFHLKEALQQRGHSVWVDVEKLSAGIDWEEGINSALTWVKDAQANGRVLLLMTPHALRRPDGYCLNEIARAASNRLSIFPVMVSESEPLPSISMLPFFDLRDCVPTDPEQLQLDANGHPWLELMHNHIHSATFQEKSQRLYAILELFESMTAYGVPAVAGIENLGVFSSFHESRHRESRVHRLLTQSSMESIDLNLTSPMSKHHTVYTAPGSPSHIRRAPPTLTSPEHVKEMDEADSLAVAFDTRYMFSYDDSCYMLARHLYEDLTASGFSVFPPPAPPISESLDSLQENANAHEEALSWVASEKNGKMILLVTPESVGRPSGVCLNDISAAMAAGIGFVPLMVRQCEIPLSICRIQWLDMSDCLIYHRDQVMSGGNTSVVASATLNEVRYNLRKDQLVTALKGKLDHEGQQARLFSLLSPFSFQLQISKLASRFVGRTWLFDRIKEWIETPSSGQVFWVTGPIGSGKTAIAARMVQSIPEIAAFHFALQEDEQTQNARRCILSLAYQLTTQLPEYAVLLQSGEPLEEVVPVSSFQALVQHLLIEPLSTIARPHSNKPLVLLIDGLEHMISSNAAAPSPSLRPSFRRSSGLGMDQSAIVTDECLVSVLPSVVSRLPPWVRIILLSREDPTILTKLQMYTPNISLDHFERENEDDIKTFITHTLGEPRVQNESSSRTSATSVESNETTSFVRHRSPSIAMSNLSNPLFVKTPSISEDQVNLIAKRSEGLFLYAVNIVQAIEEGRLPTDQLESLPIGMGGYLRQFFDNHFEEQVYKTVVRPVLEVLCAAYEPLTMQTVASILEWDAYKQLDVASSFGSLFYVTDDDYLRPFHTSVLDWVQDFKSAGSYYADVTNGHEHIGKWAAREYEAVIRVKHNSFVNLNFELESSSLGETKAHIYIVRHACNHLMQAQGEECIKLVGRFLSDENFQRARRLLNLRDKGLESFFHGDIDRVRAQELLMRNPQAGSFLIRYSATKKTYCVSFIEKVDPVTGKPKFTHNLFHHLKTGAYSLVEPSEVTPSTIVFPDLINLVERFQRKGMLTTPIPRESPLNREISSTPYPPSSDANR